MTAAVPAVDTPTTPPQPPELQYVRRPMLSFIAFMKERGVRVC